MKALALTLISASLASTAFYLVYSGGVHIYIVTGDGAHHIGAQLTDNSQPSTQPIGPAPTSSPASESNVLAESRDLDTGNGGSAKSSETSHDQNAKSDEATSASNDEIAASDNPESHRKRFHRRRYRRYYYRRYNECTCPSG
jgi:hypothetical protein